MTPGVGGGVYWTLHSACRDVARSHQTRIGADAVLVSMMRRYPDLGGLLGLMPVPRVSVRCDQVSADADCELYQAAELGLSRVMRDVRWRVFGWAKPGAPEWEDEVFAALRLAMATAVAQDARWVGADHLLEALLTDPSNSASRYIREKGVDLDLLGAVAERIWRGGDSERPRSELVDLLGKIGYFTNSGQGSGRSLALKKRWMTWLIRLLAQTTPVLAFLESEAVAETVRLGHDRTTLIHLIMAALALEEEIQAGGLYLKDEYRLANDLVLIPQGIDRERALVVAASMPQEGAIAPPQSRRSVRNSSKNPPWTESAARAVETARRMGRSGGKIAEGSAHLLYAALTDSDDSGRRLLRELSVDPVAVQDLLSRRLV